MSAYQRRLAKQRYLYITDTTPGHAQYFREKKLPRKLYFKGHAKKYRETHSGNNLRTAELLLNYLEGSNDFPDNELAENLERARSEFRKEFKIES